MEDMWRGILQYGDQCGIAMASYEVSVIFYTREQYDGFLDISHMLETKISRR